ncbi:MAG: hypothetical protein Q9168_007276 [Polycauliona sp. 1 TL-2023]
MQEPGIVNRHTRVTIDQFETFYNVPLNTCPPVRPFRGHPMHPHYSNFSSVSSTPIQLPHARGHGEARIQPGNMGFGPQVSEIYDGMLNHAPPPTGMQLVCSGHAYSPNFANPSTLQMSQNRWGHTAGDNAQRSTHPHPTSPMASVPQVFELSDNQFDRQQRPFAQSAQRSSIPTNGSMEYRPILKQTERHRPATAEVPSNNADTLDAVEARTKRRREQDDASKLRKKAKYEAARQEAAREEAAREEAAREEAVREEAVRKATARKAAAREEAVPAAREEAAREETKIATEKVAGAAEGVDPVCEMATPDDSNDMTISNESKPPIRTETSNQKAIANGPTGETRLENVKLEDGGYNEMFRFANGTVDDGEWYD